VGKPGSQWAERLWTDALFIASWCKSGPDPLTALSDWSKTLRIVDVPFRRR
jgi:hypothetical protein